MNGKFGPLFDQISAHNTMEALVQNLPIEESGELLSDFWGLVRCDEVAVKGNYCTSQRDNNKQRAPWN